MEYSIRLGSMEFGGKVDALSFQFPESFLRRFCSVPQSIVLLEWQRPPTTGQIPRDPNPIRHQWGVPKKVCSNEAPLCNLGVGLCHPRPCARHNRTSLEVLCPYLEDTEPSPNHSGHCMDLTCSRISHGYSIRLGSREFGGQVDASFLRRFCSVPGSIVLLEWRCDLGLLLP